MKYLIIFEIWVACLAPVSAQNKHDNNWVFANHHLGGSILRFDSAALQILELDTADGRAREALACMSDKDGNLLFYTNNCSIFNKKHETMENGGGMNPGQVQTYWCSVNPFANPNDNSVLILPQPGSEEQVFQVFHWDYEAFNVGQPGGSQFAPLHLYHTVVDMLQNNGLGKVLSTNNLLLEDTFTSCALQAVRHANGRDWWVLAPEFNGNCYYKILLDPSGPKIVDKQCIGSSWGRYARSGGVHFTPDGLKYIRCHTEYGLNIFDFDRCSGQLSNPLHIPIGPLGAFPINCMTLSPSGRFAYYHTLAEIYQYDLEAQDIGSSKTLVATYDGFKSAGNSTDFYKSQLAPDGKIYINSFGPVYYLHVIEHPDSIGPACEVRQHAIELPNRHFAAMPNYPNYNLGALPGLCDTISVSAYEPYEPPGKIWLIPNPVADHLRFLPDASGALPRVIRLTVFNAVGGVALRLNSPDLTEPIRVGQLAPGAYSYLLETETGTVSGKFVKQ
jgi:hypothetical protein